MTILKMNFQKSLLTTGSAQHKFLHQIGVFQILLPAAERKVIEISEVLVIHSFIVSKFGVFSWIVFEN